ncbi:MAG: ribosomal protein S18-alanine N-acetyltransferase [candidate division NC10 bacterium]|nr:ribosomal protein S18-alanine N-acetyltransferase [candidate division NC10 bacterium]
MAIESRFLMTIDRMQPEDLDDVMAIEARSFSTPWTEEMFKSELWGKTLSENLVARAVSVPGARTQVVGYTCLWIVGEELHINNIAIHPRYRRQGVAKSLLSFAFDLAKRRGARKALLEVRVSNTTAQALYQRLGFRVVGRRHQYYTSPVEDALVMAKDDL